MKQFNFVKGDLIYHNPLAKAEDLSDFKMEGSIKTSFEDKKLILENEMDPEEHGDFAHWVLWCRKDFPDEIIVEWNFKPLREPGLCMFFFSATGKEGQDIFSPDLPKRNGHYPQYHSGEINTLHLSYFRRKWEEERAFCTCNLRKSAGFHLVAQGADPIPNVKDARTDYQLRLIKYRDIVQFSVNDLVVLEWQDDGKTFGDIYSGGKVGFRQMAPMKASYSQLKVYKAIREE